MYKIKLLNKLSGQLLCSISHCALILYILMIVKSDNNGKGKIDLFTIEKIFVKDSSSQLLKEALRGIRRFNLAKFRIKKKVIEFKLGK